MGQGHLLYILEIAASAEWGLTSTGCPWCDGWEHRDKPFATLCAFSEGCVKDSMTQVTLNKSPLMLTNGTYDDIHIAKVEEALPDFKERLKVNGITVDDRVLSKINRVHGNDSDYEDDFVVTFTDNSTLVLNAMRGLFPAQLRSDLPEKLMMNVTKPVDSGDPSGASVIVVKSDMQSSILGIFAVGDTNSDGSTNVPHAMWSAKRAVVFMQTALAMGYTDALIDEEIDSNHSKRTTSAKESLMSMKRSLELPLPRYDATPNELMDYLNE